MQELENTMEQHGVPVPESNLINNIDNLKTNLSSTSAAGNNQFQGGFPSPMMSSYGSNEYKSSEERNVFVKQEPLDEIVLSPQTPTMVSYFLQS